MYRLRRWVVVNRERLVDPVVAENGKTREDALLAELYYLCDSLGFWAKRGARYLADERIRTHSPLVLGKKVVVRQRPQGVVGVIGPWIPADPQRRRLHAGADGGQSVVLKPSEIAPFTVLVVEAVREWGSPQDVFLVATGTGATGAALVDHADMIHFTGSTATGRKVAVAAAERLVPCSLELGGKDPMMVCATPTSSARRTWRSSGRFEHRPDLRRVERVYVEEPVSDEFVAGRHPHAQLPGPSGSAG